jgi:hypothetical protein
MSETKGLILFIFYKMYSSVINIYFCILRYALQCIPSYKYIYIYIHTYCIL